jgi:amidase
VTGQPAISVPTHWTDDGLPVGVQLAANMGHDPLLLQLAARLEEALPWSDRLPAIHASTFTS